MLFVNYSLSLAPSLSYPCSSSPVFYFSDGLISCTASPQPQCAFLHVDFDLLLLCGITFTTALSEPGKESVLIGGMRKASSLNHHSLC